MGKKQIVIFTDLDGTLLDKETYSPEAACPAIEKLLESRTPLVFCSAKTRKEQEVYRNELSIKDPFVVEDGGAIFIEKNFFPFSYDFTKRFNGYDVIELGAGYMQIRDSLRKIQSELGIEIVGYGNLSVAEVSALTGLSREAAERAKQREYQETLVSKYSQTQLDRLKRAIEKRDLVLTPGARFMGVGGVTDKGVAVSILSEMYRRRYGEILTVGIGDSFNDVPMFLSVDIPVLVQQTDGRWAKITTQYVHRVRGIGPQGWNDFIMEWIV